MAGDFTVAHVSNVVKVRRDSLKENPYNISYRFDIPAISAEKEFIIDLSLNDILVGKDCELIGYSYAMAGYDDGDYLNMFINDIIIEDHWYARGIPEFSSMGLIYDIYNIPSDSVIRIVFYNPNCKQKILYLKFKFLY